jgi:hypothetical protein
VNQTADDSGADAAGMEPYRVLGTFLAEAERRFGAPPEAIEEKAALEVRRVVEETGAEPAPETVPETRWIKGKMETPGIQFYDYEHTLQIPVPSGSGEEVLAKVRSYWLSRGMNVVPEAESPAGDVVADPGKGEWTLRAGVLDPLTVFIRVASGPVLTSSSPLGNEKES